MMQRSDLEEKEEEEAENTTLQVCYNNIWHVTILLKCHWLILVSEIWINETLEIQRQGDVEILKCCKEWNTEVLICWNIEMLKMWNTEMLKYRNTKHSSLNNINITDDLWIFLCRENNVYKYLTCFHWIYKTVMKHHMILVLTNDISVIW
jgi:hypothetical protein